MDKNRRKELQETYRLRCPEAGIVALVCAPTGQMFLSKARDIPAYLNGCLFRLESGSHPNRELQSLWREHGSNAFKQHTLATLEYDDPAADIDDDLELMLIEALEENPGAQVIWKR